MFGCNNDRLFPEKYTVKDHISNTERVQRILPIPPGHPIILVKSNQFNMAAVSIKRSIG